jgi:proliferating cell nuclear antigen PCNA
MRFVLESSEKISKLIEVFKVVKQLSNYCSLFCNEEHVYIQTLDGSHVCLLDAKFKKKWFDEYVCDVENISMPSSILVKIMSLCSSDCRLSFETNDTSDKIDIILQFRDNTEKAFNIPLIDVDTELLQPGENDYALEFTMKTKVLDKYVGEMMLFGEVLNISSKDENLYFRSEGNEGKYRICIPHDNLELFALLEDDEMSRVKCKVDIKYISYVSKIHTVFQFSNVYCDNHLPLKIHFSEKVNDDDDDNDVDTDDKYLFYINYFVAPKIDDDEDANENSDMECENEIVED